MQALQGRLYRLESQMRVMQRAYWKLKSADPETEPTVEDVLDLLEQVFGPPKFIDESLHPFL